MEVVVAELQAVRSADAGVLEKFDGGKIRDNYRQFCTEKGISDCLGLSYLKPDASCGN